MKIKIGDRFGYWEVTDLPAPSPRTGEPKATDKATCLCILCGGSHLVNIENLCTGKSTQCRRCANRALKKRTFGRTITRDGETLTISEWSAKTGIPARTIQTRIRLGWDPGAAVSTPTWGGRPDKKITAKGESHTLTQWISKVGISRECVRKRIAKGWTLEDAVSTPALPPGRPKSR